MIIELVFISLLQLISSGWSAGGVKETFRAIKHVRAPRKTGILKLEDERRSQRWTALVGVFYSPR